MGQRSAVLAQCPVARRRQECRSWAFITVFALNYGALVQHPGFGEFVDRFGRLDQSERRVRMVYPWTFTLVIVTLLVLSTIGHRARVR
jgi:hypothetical protein